MPDLREQVVSPTSGEEIEYTVDLTKLADNFAIAFGGSSFYRNRLNRYLKEGMKEIEAKEKAFVDFQEASEPTQQSARPDLISQQQASPLGRFVLAFQNVSLQNNRNMKRAILDLKNKRGDMKTNISKIVYYGAVQNIIFLGMQQALFAAYWDDDATEKDVDKWTEEQDKRRESRKKFENKENEERNKALSIFDAKLQAFEIEEIKNSQNKKLRSRLRRSKSIIEVNAVATMIMLESLNND